MVIPPNLLDLAQERETYRYPVKESLKCMLAMGWTIERTKEGDAMFQQREAEKQIKTSEPSQVGRLKIQVIKKKTQLFNRDDLCSSFVLLKGDGFHPAPVELGNVTLSRELQVCFLLFLIHIICII